MTKIKDTALAKAMNQSTQMDLVAAEKVVDEIYLEQPNLLGSVLVQSQLGNKIEHVNVLLNILIVSHLALKYSGVKIETISEELQQLELSKYTQHLSSIEKLNTKKKNKEIERFMASKSEKFLMAYVFNTLKESGITQLTSERSKYLIMAGVNIVNCIDSAKKI